MDVCWIDMWGYLCWNKIRCFMCVFLPVARTHENGIIFVVELAHGNDTIFMTGWTLMKMKSALWLSIFRGGLHLFRGGFTWSRKWIFMGVSLQEKYSRWLFRDVWLSWNNLGDQVVEFISWRSLTWNASTRMDPGGWLSREWYFREAWSVSGFSWELDVTDYFHDGFTYFRDYFQLSRNFKILVVAAQRAAFDDWKRFWLRSM